MISKNKCHICLKDIINRPSKNKKKCCSSNAYICNSCWDEILKNKDTEKCPICRKELPIIEDIVVEINPQVIEIRHGRNPTLLMESHLKCSSVLNIFALLLFAILVRSCNLMNRSSSRV